MLNLAFVPGLGHSSPNAIGALSENLLIEQKKRSGQNRAVI